MSIIKSLCLACCLTCGGVSMPGIPARPDSGHFPVRVIFDTDMGNDVDDALALAMLHTLQDKGRCGLLAVTLTIPLKQAAPFTAALNAFYGHPNIPIGINPDALLPEGGYLSNRDFLSLADDKSRWPGRHDGETAQSALHLLRKTLAASEPAGVVIIQVGSFTNMAALLKSPPDDISPLGGVELVKKKVRFISIMGGDFKNPSFREFNIKLDVHSAQYVAANWPTPRIWSGFEVGKAIPFPAECIDTTLPCRAPHGHIIREAYQRYISTPHERPCWDLTSTWVAVFPDTPLFTCSEPGTVSVNDNSQTAFKPASGGMDRYLKVSPDKIPALRRIFANYVSGSGD